MQILDKGEIKLLDFMGGDLSVVRSARVSNGIITETEDPERDQKLINYLMKHRHGSPFEHNVFTLYVKCPIFVAREWMRHRIGSYNEISGRYVEFDYEFYIPSEFRVSAKDNKQGSVFTDDKSLEWHELNKGLVGEAVHNSYDVYQTLLMRGVAREMARMVLPLNLYTQFYWTVNARSLMNFLSLRAAEDAQWEIRQYAFCLADFFEEKMPMTYQAWVANGKVAP